MLPEPCTHRISLWIGTIFKINFYVAAGCVNPVVVYHWSSLLWMEPRSDTQCFCFQNQIKCFLDTLIQKNNFLDNENKKFSGWANRYFGYKRSTGDTHFDADSSSWTTSVAILRLMDFLIVLNVRYGKRVSTTPTAGMVKTFTRRTCHTSRTAMMITGARNRTQYSWCVSPPQVCAAQWFCFQNQMKCFWDTFILYILVLMYQNISGRPDLYFGLKWKHWFSWFHLDLACFYCPLRLKSAANCHNVWKLFQTYVVGAVRLIVSVNTFVGLK